jgi:hypothetical protein
LWKPQRIVAGVSDVHQNTVNELATVRLIEVRFSTEKSSIVRLSRETLPSIAIVDLASSEYDAFDCCHELEGHPDIIVYCLYPDGRKDLINEAYGYGFDTSSEYSRLAERLSQVLDARYDSENMLFKLRKWLEE